MKFGEKTRGNGCSLEEFGSYFIALVKQHTAEFLKENVVLCSTPKKTKTDVHMSTPTHSSSKQLDSSLIFNGTSFNQCGFEELGCIQMKSDTPIKNSFHPLNTSSPQLRTTPHSYSIRSVDSLDITSPSFVRTAQTNDHRKSPSLYLSDFLNASSASSPSPRNTKNRKLSSTPNYVDDSPAFRNIAKHVKCADDVSHNVKQKKRVAPIKLPPATNPYEFSASAFQLENNLIGIDHKDTFRDALKTQISSITTDLFENSMIISETSLHNQPNHIQPTDDTIDLTKITCKSSLQKLIDLYSALIDLNLITNILGELSYLLNLLNADYDRHQLPIEILASAENQVVQMLKNGNNCVYLSIGVLKKQKHCLIMLDMPTIKILLENERISKYDNDLNTFLVDAYTQKQQMEFDFRQKKSTAVNVSSNLNVSYQQEHDTKDNFPSMREFTAFNKQRDMFYNILRIWESKHFIPSWSYITELGPKIRNLLGIMNHPINMSHLARLFTSKLMLSCNFQDTMPELQEALPKADMSKISKLHQRLTTPSSFSTDYLFPGLQAFFKDFLLAAEYNSVFIEQLKTALINELIDMNNSSYDTINLSMEFDIDGHHNFTEYAVLPENIVKMRVLAKFVGFIQARPYAYDGVRNSDVDNRQIQFRNMILQPFDVKDLLEKCIANHKLLVLLPWLVQYLAMLDFVTLRLDYYATVMRMLYEVYILSADCKLKMRSSSLFVVRLCLGWLFDQPNIPDTYLEYRMQRSRVMLPSHNVVFNIQKMDGFKQAGVYIPPAILDHFSSCNAKISNYELTSSRQLKCTIEFNENISTELYATTTDRFSDKVQSSIDPIMESILNSSCPFLADFRVSIMPTKHLKSVSRTGRYRHVTPKMSEAVCLVKTQRHTEIDDQTKLSEAFLHSQSLSLRRTVEFVIERTVSAVVKDYQVQVLLPVKKQANNEVTELPRPNKDELIKQINLCYVKAQQNLLCQWSELIPKWIQKRVKQAFTALLPNETSVGVKRTCVNLVIQKCSLKTTDWLANNLQGIDIFSKDIPGDAERLLKIPLGYDQRSENSFTLTNSKTFPSDAFCRLQVELHKASLKPETLELDSLMDSMDFFQRTLCEHSLPSNMYKTTGFMVLQLLLLIVIERSDLITKNLINKFISVWKNTPIVSHTKSSTDSDEEVIDIAAQDDQKTNTITGTNNIFEDIISIQYLAKMSSSPNAFEGMKIVLTELLNAKLISASELNDQCVFLFREEWPQEVLSKLSSLLQHLLESVDERPDKDSFMFMEMMSELSSEIDNY